MKPGTCAPAWRMYCGRHVGKVQGSDGKCGPTNGPQCKDCKPFIINKAGVIAKTGGYWANGIDGRNQYYCGRNVGNLPGSDGRCGPTAGPACNDCKDFKVNRAGYPMKPGQGMCSNKLYCGIYVGNLPGSDGRCGPTNGP